jgi:hypothetical protein
MLRVQDAEMFDLQAGELRDDLTVDKLRVQLGHEQDHGFDRLTLDKCGNRLIRKNTTCSRRAGTESPKPSEICGKMSFDTTVRTHERTISIAQSIYPVATCIQ